MNRAFPGPRVERTLSSELPDLPGNVRPVIPRRRPEHNTTAAPVRRPNGALPRTPGSLLLPGLLISTGDEAPALGHVGALTLVVQVHLDCLMQHGLVHRAVEVI